EGAYRVLSIDYLPLLGEEALRLAAKGDLAGAKRWLDWARDKEQLTGGDDPLSGTAFPRLWNKNSTAELVRIRVAAAALLARDDDSGKSAAILKEAREAAQTDAERTGIDLALAEYHTHSHTARELLDVVLRLRKSYPDSDAAYITQVQALRELKR